MKKATKYFLGILGAAIGFFLLIIIQNVNPEQKKPLSSLIHLFPDSLSVAEYDLDSLRDAVGTNKGLPKGFEMAALLAYSAYPELKDVSIDMVLKNSGAPMEANFDIWTLFGPSQNRKYIINLNNALNTSFDPILLRSLPFDAQVGILAHELGHVVYYHQLSALQLAKWGIMYLASPKFRAIHEKTTDLMPVYHGLGFQIHEYAYYIRHDPSCRPLYEKYAEAFIDKYYLTDEEILKAMKDFEIYSSNNY